MNKSIGNNLPRIKVTNQFAIREAIYKFGPISRISVADKLGLTLPTITTNVSLMINKGLIQEVNAPMEQKTLGRKTMFIDFVPNAKCFLGIELRGSCRYVLLSDLRGNVLASEKSEEFLPTYEDALSDAFKLASALLEKSKFSLEKLNGIGICVPGLVDASEGILIMHPGYGWSQKNIVEDFARISGYSGNICLENNSISRAYGLSLFHPERARNGNSLAYMYVSTGIACPLLNEVRNHFGVSSGEGEVGHMVMNPDGPICSCGNHGCLEAYSSEKAMLLRAKNAVREGRSPRLKELALDGENPTIPDILTAKKEGDPVAVGIVQEAIRYLGLAIANIDNFVRPECVAIECRIFDDEENRKELMDVVHSNLYRKTFSDYKFSFIPSDEFSGAKGAIAVAIRHDLEKYME